MEVATKAGTVVAPAAAAAAPAPVLRPVRPDVAGPEYEVVALTPMRAAIAKQMPLSKAPVPHFYVTSEVAMDPAWELRQELNALEGQPKISVNDLVVRACALALTEHPYVNASFQGDAVRVYHRAHIGIAVALDDGLITPVLRNCESKPLAQIAVESRDLAERARPYFGLVEPVEDPVEALGRARSLGEPVLVTGSLYLLADLAKDESVRWRTLATG